MNLLCQGLNRKSEAQIITLNVTLAGTVAAHFTFAGVSNQFLGQQWSVRCTTMEMPVASRSTESRTLYEYLLQGSILDEHRDTLVHRLLGLCDLVHPTPDKFHDHEMVYQLSEFTNHVVAQTPQLQIPVLGVDAVPLPLLVLQRHQFLQWVLHSERDMLWSTQMPPGEYSETSSPPFGECSHFQTISGFWFPNCVEPKKMFG